MKDKDLPNQGRREFLISAAVAGAALPTLGWAASRPCPPGSLSVSGGTATAAGCSSGAAPGSPPVLNLIGGGSGKAWTFGQPFRKGDIPGFVTATGAERFQADVRNRWSDGSVKFAVVSGIGGTSVQFAPADAGAGGAHVQEPTSLDVSVSFTGAVTGTYTVQSCLGIDRSTWSLGNAGRVRQITGPVMSEFHYYRPTNDAHVTVWFYVRRYANGATEVETCIENGWARVPGSSERVYSVTVSIGGASRFSGGLVHYHHTRWSRRDWVGSDPGIVPSHDGSYLRATTLVPNYAPVTVADSVLASYPQSGAVFTKGSYDYSSDAGGAAPHIGLLPQWEVAYVMSGDPRTYRAMLVNEQAANCGKYEEGANVRDEGTGLPIVLSDYYSESYSNGPTGAGHVVKGVNTTPNAAASADYGAPAKYVWKNNEAHGASSGYLAYLTTGRWFSLETCQMLEGNIFLCGGVNSWSQPWRRWGEDRGIGWGHRNLASALCITPDTQTTIRNGYVDLLQKFWAEWRTNQVGHNNLGLRRTIYNYVDYAPSPYLSCGAFQQYFIMQAFAFGFEIASEIVSSTARTQWLESIQFHGLFTTGLLGTRPDGYCFRRAGTYGLAVGPNRTADRSGFFSTWSQVYDAEVAIGKIPAGESCSAGSTLLYGNDDPMNVSGTSYFGNMHPAAAYAKQFGVPGAEAAWVRLTGSQSYRSMYADFQMRPQFSIEPR